MSAAQHPALVYLLAAHQQAEERAQAATPSPWTLDLDDETIMSESGTVARMRDYVRVMTGAQVEADARLIVGVAEPAAVLRRVGAERQILADHAKTPIGGCAACADTHHPDPRQWAFIVWPCRTMLLLSEAWGWEAP